MRTLREILDRKAQGIDCTEDESAIVKRAIRRGSDRAAELFPLEHAEVESETPAERAFLTEGEKNHG